MTDAHAAAAAAITRSVHKLKGDLYDTDVDILATAVVSSFHALTTAAPTTVWHLTAEIENGSDYDGITTLHRTREGAVAHFEEWLQHNNIPTEIAYQGVQWTVDGALGNDYQHHGTKLSWGIQEMRVRP